MTSYQWLAVVSAAAWLVLAIAGYRARNVDTRKTLLMAAAWAAIFIGMAFFVVAVGGNNDAPPPRGASPFSSFI